MNALPSADTQLAAPAESALFTALQMDHLRLLLPQTQVAATESVVNLRPHFFPRPHSLGSIPHAGHSWSLYCLDSHFGLISDPPEQRQNCVLLSAGGERFGLLCDQITTIAHAELTINPVPKCMRTEQMLLHSLAVYQDSMTYISSAERLQQLIHASSD